MNAAKDRIYRFFFRFAVATITILTANLLTSVISDWLVSYKNNYKPIVFTFVGMGIIVIVFYPLFLKLESILKAISTRVIKRGRNLAGRYLGLFLTFSTCLLILLYFYTRIWYHIDLVHSIFNGTIGNYF